MAVLCQMGGAVVNKYFYVQNSNDRAIISEPIIALFKERYYTIHHAAV